MSAARARVSQWIGAEQAAVFDAFVAPGQLTQFWLSAASAPLSVGETVRWSFLVPGAYVDTNATRLDRPTSLAWDWSDGSSVSIELEPFDGGTAVTLRHDGLPDAARALDATEGFAIVLADLKTLLETGRSAGITLGKAKLIAARS